MLRIDIMSQKGILFVKLKGNLNRQGSIKLHKNVTNFIRKVGIKNLIFNIEELTNIDKYGKKALRKNVKICEDNKGQIYICGKKITKIKTVSDELTAVKLINS